MKYWPGTNIAKSSNNAFDWGKPSDAMQDHLRHAKQSHAGSVNSKKRIAIGVKRGEAFYANPTETPYQKNFTTYSKAVPSKNAN
jgi:hypothetical protein